ncbi:MAG TPA: YHS domain-containing protein [Terriglobales bacterium]|nr:YHS domain-containing protein [Terriglobales bacterium]
MASETTATEIDPVCGMAVSPDRAAGSSVYGGKTYYFCSSECKTKFDQSPSQFAGGK